MTTMSKRIWALTANSRGYSSGMASRIKSANKKLIGVQLGRICLQQDISVAAVAAHIGVSRQIVYRWFTGEAEPRRYQRTVLALVESLAYRDS